jgi:hypothetical protein
MTANMTLQTAGPCDLEVGDRLAVQSDGEGARHGHLRGAGQVPGRSAGVAAGGGVGQAA